MVSGKVLNLLVVGNIATVILSGFEIAMALSLQMILSSLGFDIGTIDLPAFLHGWSPDNVTLFLLILIIVSGRAGFAFFSQMASSFAYVLIQSRLKLAVFFELLQRDKPIFLSAAEINFRNTEVARNTGVFISSINKLLGAIIQAAILLSMMLWVSWPMTITSVLMFGLVGVVILLVNRRINHMAKQLPQKSRQIVRGIERIARNWLLVRILRMQD
jgi:ABC-type multidrug transport system fused ATPase/permease subunit